MKNTPKTTIRAPKSSGSRPRPSRVGPNSASITTNRESEINAESGETTSPAKTRSTSRQEFMSTQRGKLRSAPKTVAPVYREVSNRGGKLVQKTKRKSVRKPAPQKRKDAKTEKLGSGQPTVGIVNEPDEENETTVGTTSNSSCLPQSSLNRYAENKKSTLQTQQTPDDSSKATSPTRKRGAQKDSRNEIKTKSLRKVVVPMTPAQQLTEASQPSTSGNTSHSAVAGQPSQTTKTVPASKLSSTSRVIRLQLPEVSACKRPNANQPSAQPGQAPTAPAQQPTGASHPSTSGGPSNPAMAVCPSQAIKKVSASKVSSKSRVVCQQLPKASACKRPIGNQPSVPAKPGADPKAPAQQPTEASQPSTSGNSSNPVHPSQAIKQAPASTVSSTSLVVRQQVPKASACKRPDGNQPSVSSQPGQAPAQPLSAATQPKTSCQENAGARTQSTRAQRGANPSVGTVAPNPYVHIPGTPLTTTPAVFDSEGRRVVDSVAIYESDARRLTAPWFYNDKNILFLWNKILEKNKNIAGKLFILDSLIFPKLAHPDLFKYETQLSRENVKQLRNNCANIKVQSKVDLFKKDLVIFPLHYSLHWMLVVILHPGKGIVKSDEVSNIPRNEECPLIILFDSKGIVDQRRNHRLKVIISGFLKLRFMNDQKSKEELRPYDYQTTRIRIIQPINLKIQPNDHDCGPFVVHFFEKVVHETEGLLSLEDLPHTHVLDWNNLDASSPHDMLLLREKFLVQTSRTAPSDANLREFDRIAGRRIITFN